MRSGRAEDCGCYGGFITQSIWQSVAINALYLLLIVMAWASLPRPAADPVWKLGSVILAIAIAGGAAEFALRSEFSTGTPLLLPPL